MAGADKDPSAARRNLRQRVVVGGGLAVAALALLWLGGAAFQGLVLLATGILADEWLRMQRTGPVVRVIGVLLVVASGAAAILIGAHQALFGLAGAAVVLFVLGRFRLLPALGILYAGAPAIALIWMRGQPDGLALVLWTMAIVWATDILAYFTGRAVGGPKIWPRVSPNKTWAGLAGGMAGAGLTGAALSSFAFPGAAPLSVGAIAMALAVLAQAGDFFESALKRRAGVKDSGHILPGHGGVMDRLDGLVPVAVAVALSVALS